MLCQPFYEKAHIATFLFLLIEMNLRIHVQHDGKVAKFWLQPIKLQNTGGFSATELNQIARTVEKNQVNFLEKWHDFFGS